MFSDAAWELEPNAFAELLERPESCEASDCCCPQGREYESAKYKMLRCSTCGSHCLHSRCLPEAAVDAFTCADCVLPTVPAVPAVPDPSALPSVGDSVRPQRTDDSDRLSERLPDTSARPTAHASHTIPVPVESVPPIEDDEHGTDTSVAAPADANISLEVEFVETPNDPISISTDDDESADDRDEQENRRQPQHCANSASAQSAVSLKRQRVSDGDGDVKPQHSKRIRRALCTMKNQSKITSFFSSIGAGPIRTGAFANGNRSH